MVLLQSWIITGSNVYFIICIMRWAKMHGHSRYTVDLGWGVARDHLMTSQSTCCQTLGMIKSKMNIGHPFTSYLPSMSPVFLSARPAVFFDPADFEDIDAILHYDDDPKHSTHVCMNCQRIESPDNVCLAWSFTMCTSWHLFRSLFLAQDARLYSIVMS